LSPEVAAVSEEELRGMKKKISLLCLQALINNLSDAANTPGVLEHRFHPVRRWRFDAAFPERKIAVEIDGGTFIGGRHTRGAGFKADCEKINMAGLLGWRVFRFLPSQLTDGVVYETLASALKVKEMDTS
jgi:very-short-patch-repair endonuclease